MVAPGGPSRLYPTRIKRRAEDRVERARLGAWVEDTVLRHDGDLVAVVVPDDDIECLDAIRAEVRAVVERHRLPLVEVSKGEIARVVGASRPSVAEICSALVEQETALASDLEA